MEEIKKFYLKVNANESHQLEFEQKICELNILGVALEKQYKLENGSFLLFSTDNCAFEEQLHLTLISKDFKLLDSIDLGLEYVSGILENVQVLNTQTIEFDFFPKNRYRVFINNSGRFIFTHSLSEVHYSKSFFSKKYLTIVKLPQEDSAGAVR